MTQAYRKHLAVEAREAAGTSAIVGKHAAFSSPRIERFVIGLSAAVLILCHGAFGALHLSGGPSVPPTVAGGLATTHHPFQAPSGVPEEHPASHHADAEYFAVLLGTFLGGLTLWLPLLNDRWRDGRFSARRFVGSPPATVFNLPRGPTLPFLQVLRL